MRSNPTQIEAWLDQHGDALYQYALLKTSDPEIAADLVQDTFEAVIRSSSFQGKSKVRSWLIGILRHKITDYYRRKYRKLERGRVKRTNAFTMSISLQPFEHKSGCLYQPSLRIPRQLNGQFSN